MDQSQELVAWLAAQPKLNARSKSGYILFSAEIRKRIMQENPEAGFGEVSKIVGIEVRSLLFYFYSFDGETVGAGTA